MRGKEKKTKRNETRDEKKERGKGDFYKICEIEKSFFSSFFFYNGGIRDPFTLPIEAPTTDKPPPLFLSSGEVDKADEASVIGALKRIPNLYDTSSQSRPRPHSIPKYCLISWWRQGPKEREGGTGACRRREEEEDWEDNGEDNTEGTRTAARSLLLPPTTLAACRGR